MLWAILHRLLLHYRPNIAGIAVAYVIARLWGISVPSQVTFAALTGCLIAIFRKSMEIYAELAQEARPNKGTGSADHAGERRGRLEPRHRQPKSGRGTAGVAARWALYLFLLTLLVSLLYGYIRFGADRHWLP